MVTGFDLLHKNKPLQKHWIKRFIAYLIDFLISSVLVYIVFLLLTLGLFSPTMLLYFPMTAGIIQVFYSSFWEYTYKKTIGKALMGLEVGTLTQVFEISDALLRNISKLHGILVLLDWMAGMATEGDPRQRYLDRLTDTTVQAHGEPLHLREFLEDHLYSHESDQREQKASEEGRASKGLEDESRRCRECGGPLKDIGEGKSRCRDCGRIQ
ncbi:MAG: RDD family protein [Candidatus Natronoplasma sp.]